MRKIWLPCALTILNLACGFFSLIFVVKDNFQMAVTMFLMAALFDTIDGRLARYLGATSDFGKELDSLADLVSFGIAPATLLYMTMLHYDNHITSIEFLLPAIFATCGALRLARYNVLNIKDYFVGIPIPVAGGLLFLSIILLKNHPSGIMVISVILSALMISEVKIPRK